MRAMPGILRFLLAGVTEEQARWKPAPERWSILEVLGHLAHVEAHGFRGRLEKMLAEDMPRLPSYEPGEHLAAGAYAHPDVAAALGAFATERARSLELLRALPEGVESRGGIHSALGPVTASDLLHEWPFHDLGHLRQIAELLRAVAYYPHLGAWQRFYTVNP